MRFEDYSPPAIPTPEQQRDALQKGLGRAVLWAESRRLNEDLLLKACLTDLRFDAQCEDSRGYWLWWIMQTLDVVGRFRVPLLHALHTRAESRTIDQLCQLAQRYAESGDLTFRTILQEIVESQPFPDSAGYGVDELIALDGEAGFLFAVGARGRDLARRVWAWEDEYLVHQAVERLGEARVSEILESSADVSVSRFRDAWRCDVQSQALRGATRSRRDELAAIPVDEIVGPNQFGKRPWLRGWGKYASDDALRVVQDHLWAERDAHVIVELLSVFSTRPLPNFDLRLIDLCRHEDSEVRRRALIALAQNAHSCVREFALDVASKGMDDGGVADLFVRNFRPGDEPHVLEMLRLPDDSVELHRLLMAVRDLLEKNQECDASQLGVVCYAATPCALCRYSVVKLLVAQGNAPDWLLREIWNDVDTDCRSLGNTGPPLS